MTRSFCRNAAILIAVPLLAFQLVAGSAVAQNVWIPTGIGSWNSSFSWSLGAPPDSFTDAWINNGGTARIIAAGAQASDLYLGKNSGQSGSVQVSGLGTLTTDFDIYVGEGGTGNLQISGGGDVTSKTGLIGTLANSTGTATVSGAGSTWITTSSAIVVGSAGNASLTIENGATVNSGKGVYDSIGFGATSTSTAIVTGPGSNWINSFGLRVAGFGSGTLRVENGAVVNSGLAVIAEHAGSIGNVTVTGTGSTWTAGLNLPVGGLGAATLTIAGGGTVSVAASAGQASINTLSTINIGEGAAAGMLLAGSLVNDGVLSFDHTDAATFSTPLSGAGQVSKVNGAGDTTLANVSAFTGTFSVHSGLAILQGNANANGYLAAANGTLRFSGGTVNLGTKSIRANDSATVEYENSLVSGGFLRGTGSHVLRPGTGNAFVGVTTFNSTTIIQDGGGAFDNFINGGTFYNNAYLEFDGVTNTSSGNVVVSNLLYTTDFTTNGVLSVVNTGLLTNEGGNLVTGGGSRTTVDSLSAIDLQAGTMELNGGLLVNEGSITGTVNVNYGSLAKGSGTYGVVNVNEGGVYAPGSSPGVSTAAAVEFESGAFTSAAPRLVMELAGTAPGEQFDQLHVTDALSLAGVLDVTLTDNFVPNAGDSFDILDWGTLSGTFSSIALPALAGLAWDTSQLYVNGELRIAAAPGLPGDFNHDSAVNAADYVTWRKGVGIESTPANYNLWRTNFGRTAAGSAAALSDATVPEPGALAIALFAAIAYAHRRVRLTRSQRRR